MKLLVVGLGSIGQRHVRCLRQLCGDQIEILAYRQRGLNLEITDDLQAREVIRLEDRYQVRSFSRLEDALAEGPMAGLVCTPNHLHIPVAIELAKAGLHLFLEKPISHSWDGVDVLQRLLDRHHRICCVGYHLRFHPGIQQMIAMVGGGALGKFIGAYFDFGEHMPFWHRYEDYSQTFMAKAAEGGGVTLTQIHDIDIIYALFGLPSTVFSAGGSTGTLKMDAEDHASSLLVYGQDSDSFAVTLTHDCLRYPPRRSYTVHGVVGSLYFDSFCNELQYTPFNGQTQTIYSDPQLQRNALFVDQMKHFLACVRGEETPRVNLQDGANSLRIALAIKESLRCRQPVALTMRKSSL
jgi:predicted dehydrogenase